jgi:hypothetical protein
MHAVPCTLRRARCAANAAPRTLRRARWRAVPRAHAVQCFVCGASRMACDVLSQHRDGALNVNPMNVKYGGKQKTPRESKIPSDMTEAAAYLGSYDAKMVWRGKTYDCKLKPGDTQHYYFRVRPHPEPCAQPARSPRPEPGAAVGTVLAAIEPVFFLPAA